MLDEITALFEFFEFKIPPDMEVDIGAGHLTKKPI